MLVWELPSGEVLGNENGDIMHIFCTDLDPVKMQEAQRILKDAARHYGFPEGRPVFWNGKRPIDDEELEHQLARARAGLVPDPLDISAIKEEEEALRHERQTRS
jgi:hypothetical protein